MLPDVELGLSSFVAQWIDQCDMAAFLQSFNGGAALILALNLYLALVIASHF